MVTGHGFPNRNLNRDEIAEIVSAAARALKIDGKRVLVIIPDGTRTMPMPLMFELFEQEFGARFSSDVIPDLVSISRIRRELEKLGKSTT